MRGACVAGALLLAACGARTDLEGRASGPPAAGPSTDAGLPPCALPPPCLALTPVPPVPPGTTSVRLEGRVRGDAAAEVEVSDARGRRAVGIDADGRLRVDARLRGDGATMVCARAPACGEGEACVLVDVEVAPGLYLDQPLRVFSGERLTLFADSDRPLASVEVGGVEGRVGERGGFEVHDVPLEVGLNALRVRAVGVDGTERELTYPLGRERMEVIELDATVEGDAPVVDYSRQRVVLRGASRRTIERDAIEPVFGYLYRLLDREGRELYRAAMPWTPPVHYPEGGCGDGLNPIDSLVTAPAVPGAARVEFFSPLHHGLGAADLP